MESLNNMTQNETARTSAAVNHDLRYKRRNGLNQYQFQQMFMKSNLQSLEAGVSALDLDKDSMLDQQSNTCDYEESEQSDSISDWTYIYTDFTNFIYQTIAPTKKQI